MANRIKTLEAARKQLGNEQVLAHVFGTYEGEMYGNKVLRPGIFIATETRVVFFSKKLFFGFIMESFPYKRISSISRSGAVLGDYIQFHTSGNTVSMKWIQKSAQEHPLSIKDFVTMVDEKISNQ